MSEVWGWKATLTVYVKGDQYDIEKACDTAVDAIEGLPGVDFAGALLEEVRDPPKREVA